MKADEFNEWYQVGQPVFHIDDFGVETQTETRTPAWELGNGAAVVSVKGRTGGQCLSRIKIIECHRG